MKSWTNIIPIRRTPNHSVPDNLLKDEWISAISDRGGLPIVIDTFLDSDEQFSLPLIMLTACSQAGKLPIEGGDYYEKIQTKVMHLVG